MSPTRTSRTTAPSGPNGRVIAIAIGLVVALAAITALLVSGGDDDTAASDAGDDQLALENFGAVEVEGQPLPFLPRSGDDPAIGTIAPTITSEQPGGTTTVEPGADGEPMVVVFLAHWCPHCQAELPRFVELAEQGEFDGLRTVAVATSTTSERPNFPPAAWLDREGWTGDRFFDDQQSTAAAAYGVSSFPFTVLLDADGEVVARFVGDADERLLAGIAAAT